MVRLFINSKCQESNKSGSRSCCDSSTTATDCTDTQKAPESLGSPTHLLPSCAAQLQPPHVSESWGGPGGPDEKQEFSSSPAATSLLVRCLQGQTDGEEARRGAPAWRWDARRAPSQTSFSGSQMPIYRFQRETRSAVSACRIKWVN